LRRTVSACIRLCIIHAYCIAYAYIGRTAVLPLSPWTRQRFRVLQRRWAWFPDRVFWRFWHFCPSAACDGRILLIAPGYIIRLIKIYWQRTVLKNRDQGIGLNGSVKRSTGHTHTHTTAEHTTAEQTTHPNTERATAQRRVIVEVVVDAPKLPPSAALLLSSLLPTRGTGHLPDRTTRTGAHRDWTGIAHECILYPNHPNHWAVRFAHAGSVKTESLPCWLQVGA